ncbi:putative toxin-antitoxin system toxin component, PIN family [Salinibacter grassmerensis]|uniref:putative toxin-antitoxin system toxin component, PIN family n=1 Tax=Salinibacter grassmerensis TaxID=3040353 RepID=UPI0021E87BE2|nr:putative toxin-antitoxin system toxin component, PIN family [Salinibacter grassmerensis]
MLRKGCGADACRWRVEARVAVDTNIFVPLAFSGLPRQVVELWFDDRITLSLSDPTVMEYQKALQKTGAVGRSEKRVPIEAFASREVVLYTPDPPSIKGISSDLDDNKILEYAPELEAEAVVSGDSDLLELGSHMGIPVPAT